MLGQCAMAATCPDVKKILASHKFNGSILSVAVKVVKGTAHIITTHKVIAGIVLGVIGVATGGAGFLVEGAGATIALDIAATTAGGIAASLDTKSCLQGDRAACVGSVLGGTAALAGLPTAVGAALGVSEASTSGALLFGFLPGTALNLGAGALTTDFALWLSDTLNAGKHR